MLYNGKFSIDLSKGTIQKKLTNEELFKNIDETLSVFSYICYLEKIKALKKADLKFFVYEIKRIMDNKHRENYLYSLYHWSTAINTTMSFSYLVDYGIKNKFLDKSFKNYSNENIEFTCFLEIPKGYKEKFMFSQSRRIKTNEPMSR